MECQQPSPQSKLLCLSCDLLGKIVEYLDEGEDVLSLRMVNGVWREVTGLVPWSSLYELDFDEYQEPDVIEEEEDEDEPLSSSSQDDNTPECFAEEQALWRERYIRSCSHAGTGVQPFLTYAACHFDFTNDEREVLSFRCSLIDARSFKQIADFYAYILPVSCTAQTLKQSNLLPPTIKFNALTSEGKTMNAVLTDFHAFLAKNKVLVGEDSDNIRYKHSSNDVCSPLIIKVKYQTEEELAHRPWQKFALLVGDDCTGRTLAENALGCKQLRRYLTTWTNLKDIFSMEYGKKARSLDDMLQHFALEACASKQRKPAHKGMTSRQACRNLLELSRQIAVDGYKLPLTRAVKL